MIKACRRESKRRLFVLANSVQSKFKCRDCRDQAHVFFSFDGYSHDQNWHHCKIAVAEDCLCYNDIINYNNQVLPHCASVAYDRNLSSQNLFTSHRVSAVMVG